MKESTQNIIYKWTLRAKYIYIFLVGAGVLSFGLNVFIDPKLFSTKEGLNIFAVITSVIIGLILIVVGFYRKNEIENYILEKKL